MQKNVNKKPEISVLLCVFNNGKTIAKSIESILNQTFENLELIICDDGSMDESLTVIERFAKKDNRIVFFRNLVNRGLSYSLNECIKIARGTFCARMDGDDLCDENRLIIEYNFLKTHDEYDFVTTSMKKFDEQGFYYEPQTSDSYAPTKKDFIKGSPYSHASLLIRKSAYLDVEGYRDCKKTKGVEDYDLWFRLLEKKHFGCILRQPLYYMFDGRDANSRRTFRRRLNEAWVRRDGYKRIKVPFFKRIYVLKPILIGLMPKFVYKLFKRRKKDASNNYYCNH